MQVLLGEDTNNLSGKLYQKNVLRTIKMMNTFCGVVDRQKALSPISGGGQTLSGVLIITIFHLAVSNI